MRQIMSAAVLALTASFLAVMPAAGQEITSTPSSLSFSNTYVGKTTGSKVITITNVSTGTVIIESAAFDCPAFGISAGVAPTSLFKPGNITHYSIFFQPLAAQTYNCNFILTLQDNTTFSVPLTGTGLTSTATVSISPTTLSFPNQAVGSTSASQTFTITETGTSSINLTAITISPPTFSVGAITLPYTIAKGGNLTVTVFYSPNQVTSETGAIDLTFNKIPDQGVTVSGNGVTASSLSIATSATLPQ